MKNAPAKHIYGILGGYGVVATNRFHYLLNQKWIESGAYDDPHFPHTVTTNLAIPVMDVAGYTLDLDLFEKTLKQNSKYFSETLSTFALCNTFHKYEDLMRKHIPNLISLPETVRNSIPLKGKVLVAASNLTLNSDLYDKGTFIKIKYPSDTLIADGLKNKVSLDELEALILFAEKGKVEAILLACTDLSIATDQLRQLTNIPVYDSLEILVNFIFDKEKLC